MCPVGTGRRRVDPGLAWVVGHPTHKRAVLGNLEERERQVAVPRRRGACTLKALTGIEAGILANEVK